MLCQRAGAQARRKHGQNSWPEQTEGIFYTTEPHAQYINWRNWLEGADQRSGTTGHWVVHKPTWCKKRKKILQWVFLGYQTTTLLIARSAKCSCSLSHTTQIQTQLLPHNSDPKSSSGMDSAPRSLFCRVGGAVSYKQVEAFALGSQF